MWTDRRLLDLLGIDCPILQAPMLGSSTAALTAAVAEAGGFGFVACGSLPAADIAARAAEVRALTNRGFGLNLFVDRPGAPLSPPALARVRAALQPHYDAFGLGPVPETVPDPAWSFGADTLAAVLEAAPRAVSFHYGAPDAPDIAALKAAGIALLSTATTVAEAQALEAAGMDAVIAQGWEAGGHRGAHRYSPPGEGVGTLALVPQVVDAVSLPVVATGGIAEARGIAAAMVLGASGVQIGTGYLRCPECGTDAARLARLARAADSDTVMTDAISGRSARSVRSAYAADLAPLAGHLPPFPTMYALAGPLLAAAAEQCREEAVNFMLYGQAAALAREMPASALTRTLAEDALSLLRHPTG